MKLMSFGCSFIYGTDLLDCPHDNKLTNPSALTWPALLAKKYGLEYQCHARPASGNLQILETLLSTDFEWQKNLYVINWTWIDRFSYISDEAKTNNLAGSWVDLCHSWNSQGWCSILPSDNDTISKIYYGNIHSQFRDKLETLICIKTSIDTLLQNDQKFIMTYTDELTWETQWHTSPAIINLQKYSRPYFCDFQGKSFFEWAKNSRFKINDRFHPLEDAHKAAADLMLPKIDTILRKA